MTTSQHSTVRHQPQTSANGQASADEFRSGSLAALGFAHAANDTYATFLPPLLPPLIEKLSLSKTEAGLIAFLSTSPSLLQPVVGYLADRADLRWVVIVGPAIVASMMSLLGVAPRLAVVALLVIIAGLGSAVFHAVASPLAGRLAGRSVGRGMGVWMVGGALGYTLGPLIVVSALNFVSLEGTPWLVIGGWVASGILFVFLRRIPARPAGLVDHDSWRDGFHTVKPTLVPVAGIILMRAFLVGATFTFLPTYLTEQGAPLWFAGLSVSISAGSGMVGSLVGGSMSDLWGRRRVLAGFLVAAPMLAFALLGARDRALVPVLVLLGFAVPPSQVITLALIQESSDRNRAFATGIYLALGFMSESIAALTVGILADFLGLRFAIAASAILMLLSLPIVLLLPEGDRASTSDEHLVHDPAG
jgi:FSR family fosmidomycin resistance protein-like MFS transporter